MEDFVYILTVIGVADSLGRIACGADAVPVTVSNFLCAIISYGVDAFSVRPRVPLDFAADNSRGGS